MKFEVTSSGTNFSVSGFRMFEVGSQYEDDPALDVEVVSHDGDAIHIVPYGDSWGKSFIAIQNEGGCVNILIFPGIPGEDANPHIIEVPDFGEIAYRGPFVRENPPLSFDSEDATAAAETEGATNETS